MEIISKGLVAVGCLWVALHATGESGLLTHSPEFLLTLATGGHSCLLSVQKTAGIRREDLIHARVRVRGVFSARPNLRGQMAGLRLFVSDLDCFQILKNPPADPFRSRPVH